MVPTTMLPPGTLPTQNPARLPLPLFSHSTPAPRRRGSRRDRRLQQLVRLFASPTRNADGLKEKAPLPFSAAAQLVFPALPSDHLQAGSDVRAVQEMELPEYRTPGIHSEKGGTR